MPTCPQCYEYYDIQCASCGYVDHKDIDDTNNILKDEWDPQDLQKGTVHSETNYYSICPYCNESIDHGTVKPEKEVITCSECGEDYYV